MKVYLAARYCEKNRIAKLAEDLPVLEVESTSSWYKEDFKPDVSMHDVEVDVLELIAKRDIREIQEADVFVQFTIDPDSPMIRGGMHFECGYAWALKKPILLVGPRQNVFHHLPGVERVKGWKEAKTWLRAKSLMRES